MRRFLIALCLAVGVSVFAVPNQAPAATRVVYVQTFGVPTSWPVNSSLTWVDSYTGSDMVRARCRAGYKCISIRYATIRSEWAAVTMGDVTCRSCAITIYLNPQRNGYGYYTKRSILDHELGHANGVTWHDTSCISRMYYRVFCPNGSLPPRRFTPSERERLRVN